MMKKNNLYNIEYFQKIKSAQKEKNRKKRIRRIVALVAILIITLYLILPISKINEISIFNNYRYSDQQIKEFAQVSKGDFLFLNPQFVIKNRLNKTNLFTNIEVELNGLNNLNIKLVETRILFYIDNGKEIIFYDENSNRLGISDNSKIKYMGMSPQLVSEIKPELQDKLIIKLSKLEDSILNEISQIKYTPKSYDKEFFTLTMSSKKRIYIKTNLDNLIKVGKNYHIFSANIKYSCAIIEYLDSENKAIVKKC